MPPNTTTKEKSNETDATKMIKAAESLDKTMPVALGGDTDLIHAIGQQISSKTARAAQNTAETMYLDSEIEKNKKQKELDTMRDPPKVSPHSTPMFGGFGGGGGRNAIIQTILNSMPEDRRASFIEQNKEALLGESNSGLFALAGKAQSQGNGGNGHSGGLETAALISAISEMQERSLLTAQRLLPQQPQSPAQPQQGQLGAVELITFMKDMQMNNMTMMNTMAQQFTQTMQSVQQGYRDIQEKHSAEINSMQSKVLDAQKESIEKDKEYLMRQVEELRAQPNTPANVLTIQHLPVLKQMLSDVGMKVSTEGAAAEGDRRKWDLEDKKLDMSKEDKERAWQLQLEERRLEAEKAKSRTAAFSSLAGLVGQAINGARVSKALTNGSPNAVAVGGRFSE